MTEIKKKRHPLIRVIFDYIKMHKFAFIFSVVCILFAAFGHIAAPQVLQRVTNALIEAASDNIDKSDESKEITPD